MGYIPFFAKRFVAGTDVQQALEAVRKLNAARIAATLDILGENVSDEGAARRVCAAHIDLVRTIKHQNLNSGVSLKLTQMGLDTSIELAEELLSNLLTSARDVGCFVRLDMEGSAYTSRTLELFLKMRQSYEKVGIVLQAYLHRTEEDLARVIEAGGTVRLCKGAYKEPATVAIQNMEDIRRNYLKLSEQLLAKSHHPAFATHDDQLIEPLKVMTVNLPKNSFEFQMLYGLRRATWLHLVEEGYLVRVYVPYGTMWRPYFVRRLRERKENVFFILKNLFKS